MSVVFFVDARVADAATLTEGLRRAARIVYLSADSDALVCIAESLAHQAHLDALHLVCHGMDGG